MTIGRQHKIVNNFLNGTSLLVKKCAKKNEITIEKNVTYITKAIYLRVIQKILSLKINSINPSWLTALKSKYINGIETTNAIKVEMLESQR